VNLSESCHLRLLDPVGIKVEGAKQVRLAQNHITATFRFRKSFFGQRPDSEEQIDMSSDMG
jgi:hypothetical protein